MARRVRTGCITCRARKIKCDETAGGCQNCRLRQLQCDFQANPLHEPIQNDCGQKDTRPACQPCRQARARCSRGHPCSRCLARDVPCVYPPGRPGDGLSLTPAASARLAAGLRKVERTHNREAINNNNNINISLQHVSAFFECIAPYQANGFLHRATLQQRLAEQTVPETLILALCAITARFVQGSSVSASQLAEQAQQRLFDTDEISVSHCAAAVLLAKHAAYSGRFNTAFLLAALANRYALKLRLYTEGTGNAIASNMWIDQEQNRRLMFACYAVDRMTATGREELTCSRARDIMIQLPADEYSFQHGIPCITPLPTLEGEERAESRDGVGIMGHYVLLVGIRYGILRYIENITHQDPPWQGKEYDLLLRKLARWKTNLPARLSLTESNLNQSETAKHGPLVMLHLWWDMLHCELFRLALQTHQPDVQALFLAAPPGWITQTQDRCVMHARQMGSTLSLLESCSPGCVVYDPSLAMLCYAAVKIQLLYAVSRDPLGLQGEAVHYLSVLLQVVDRLTPFFNTAAVLLDEMKWTLRQHGIGPWSESPPADAKDHPWLDRVRDMEQGYLIDIDQLLMPLL
ncbi:hypothetical protein ASPZODRAFT_18034 [Penicilliopsis zonata CBS 506.65]|uniref:Zn(2)-C6 fungal-type domain-containing protein n=1 Tax=Penicilliopsis zonata CBS 506.65 TaxID=1073090 RepID=A0A1L9SDF3_9EURO|nr:hypothetical protein ASPZODRAFT_18034 [Penicilliopsis zonata CBS 506.65]OJJ45124.1 hypothetical protein ASPZODRAFT_18034 [Penicilliopsis zonata CBS 506.65]